MGIATPLFGLLWKNPTFFLRDYDPENNFEEEQAYFSDLDLSSFAGQVLFDGEVEISAEQIVFFQEDDEDTEDIDESTLIDPARTLAPGLRIPLNIDFFQQKILDQEGSANLLSPVQFLGILSGDTNQYRPLGRNNASL